MITTGISHPALEYVAAAERLWADDKTAQSRANVVLCRLIAAGFVRGDVAAGGGMALAARSETPDYSQSTSVVETTRELVDALDAQAVIAEEYRAHLATQPESRAGGYVLREYPRTRELEDLNARIAELRRRARRATAPEGGPSRHPLDTAR